MLTRNFNSQLSLLADQLSNNGYFVIDNVFANESLQNLNHYFNENMNQLNPASIGNKSGKILNSQLRSDKIFWVNENDKDLLAYRDMTQTVTKYLKQELYLPLKSTETQMALYEYGSFYVRHKDRHVASNHRWISLVFYLNQSWDKECGGQLKLYNDTNSEITIDPIYNRCILFKSEIEHEVLPCFFNRKSFTTWFRDDIIDS